MHKLWCDGYNLDVIGVDMNMYSKDTMSLNNKSIKMLIICRRYSDEDQSQQYLSFRKECKFHINN